MANYYTVATAEKAIPTTKEAYAKLAELINATPEDEDAELHGFEVEEHSYVNPEKPELVTAAYLFAQENAHWCAFSDEVVDHIAEMLKLADMPHIQVGVAFTCNRCVVNSHGGTSFRIYQNGDLDEETKGYKKVN